MHTIANGTRYFIAFLPPPPLVADVLSFRAQWQVQDTMPHITVKAPCGLGAEESWLAIVRQNCQLTPPVPICIEEVSSFGEAVITLRVSSPELVALHLRLVDALAISPADQALCFEGLRFSPHLTILYAQSVRESSFSALGQAARDWFATPQIFQAEKLVIYRKTAGASYSIYLEIPLLGSSVS